MRKEETIKKVIELLKGSKKELYYSISEDLENYNDGYFDDAIHEIADNNTSIYYSDILEWAKENISEVNKGIEEFGTSGDVFKDLQASEYLTYIEEIHEDLESAKYNIFINFIIKELETNEDLHEDLENESRQEEFIKYIKELCCMLDNEAYDFDTCDKYEDLESEAYDKINDFLNGAFCEWCGEFTPLEELEEENQKQVCSYCMQELKSRC